MPQKLCPKSYAPKVKTLTVTKKELIGELTWEQAVLQRKVIPYFKPTRTVHDSGYRNSETGYINLGGDKKYVMGSRSDHVSFMEPLLKTGRQPSFNMDVDLGGHIRIFRGYKWDNDDYALSSAILTYIGELKDQ